MRRTMSMAALLAGGALALAGCNMLGGDKGGDKAAGDQAGGEKAGGDKAPDPGDKATFLKAYVAAACAVKTSADLSKAVELTRGVYEKHGFNQMTYAAATNKWAEDAEVKEALKAGMAKCVAPAEEAKPAEVSKEGEASGETDGDDLAKKGDAAKPAEGDAAKPAEGAAKPAEADAAEGDKAADKPEASAHAGAWKGSITSKDVRGAVSFVVKDDGRLEGEIQGRKPKAFKIAFDGQVRGGKFQLNGRKKGATHHAFLRGAVDKKGVVVGEWEGTVAKKRQKGTWLATKAK